MRPSRHGLLVAMLVLAACSAGDDAEAPAKGHQAPPATSALAPVLEPDTSPLGSLTIAEDIDRLGSPIRPSAKLTDAAPSVTALVRVQGAGTVTFRWFQVPDNGEPKPLFSHAVAAEPGQVAFSTGVSPGTLAVGTYRVEATLGDDKEVAEFVVEPSTRAQATTPAAELLRDATSHQHPQFVARASASSASTLSGFALLAMSAGQAHRSSSTTGPPRPGQSGTRATSASAASPAVPTEWIYSYVMTPDFTSSTFDFGFTYNLVQPTDLDILVAIGGRSMTRTVALLPPSGALPFSVDPCLLGRDLPNTQIDILINVRRAGPVLTDLMEFDDYRPIPPQRKMSLGPDTTKPTLPVFDTSLPPRSHVEPGETIGVEIIARDRKYEGSTWQTGVGALFLLANGEVVRTVAGDTPPICDDAKRVLDLQADYQVPADPPAVIKLCARAVDYAGNQAERCHEYSTRETWEGTSTGQIQARGCTPTSQTVHLELSVDARGNVEGRGTTVAGAYTCDNGASIPTTTAPPYTFSGTRTRAGFTLHFGGGAPDVTLAISGRVATGTYRVEAGTIPLRLECKTCGPSLPVG